MIKKHIHIFLFAVSIFLLGTTVTYAQNEFITVWKTDNPGASTNEQIYFPGIGDGYTIVWEKLNASGNVTHTGTINNIKNLISSSGSRPFLLDFRTVGGIHSNTGAGTYRIKASPGAGTFIGFTLGLFTPDDSSTFQIGNRDPKKLIEVVQWGNIAWKYLYSAFEDASNMTMSATQAPNLSGISTYGFNSVGIPRMFKGCSSFNTNINNWDVSNITEFNGLFENATSFNQPLNNWNVSKAGNMYRIFSGATSFNQPLDNWDVSKVDNFFQAFAGTRSFNQPLHTWKFKDNKRYNAFFKGESGMTPATWDKTLIGWARTRKNRAVVLRYAEGVPYCVAEQERLSSGVDVQPVIRICPTLTTPSGINKRPEITSVPFSSSIKNYGQEVTFRVTDASGTVVYTEVRPASNTQLEFSYTPTTDLAFGQYKAEIVTTHFGNEYTLTESTGAIEGGMVTTTLPTCTTVGTNSIANYTETATYTFNPNTSGISINPITGLISGLTQGQSYTVTVTQENGTSTTSEPFINHNSIEQSTLLPTPTGSSNQTFSPTNNPTVANLVASGTNVQWYTNPEGKGISLPNTTPLIKGNSIYYAFSTSGTCKSANGLMVRVNNFDGSSSCTITPSKNSICVGETINLSAVISPAITDWTGYTINWSTSDETIAAVQVDTYTTATLIGVSEGAVSVNFTYSKGGTTINCATTIQVSPTTAGGSVNNLTYIGGDTAGTTLTLTGNVGNVIHWERSGNSSFTSPTVLNFTSTTLNVSGLSVGTYYYRAKVKSGNGCDPAYSGAATVTVISCSSGISGDDCAITPSKNSICVGETINLSAVISPAITDWTGYTINWSTSDETIATVQGNTNTTATLTGVSGGGVNVIYTYSKGGVTINCATTIQVSSTTVGGSIGNITYCKGETITGTTLTLTGNVGNVLHWERSKNSSFTSPTVLNFTSTTLNVSGLSEGTYYYRAKVKSGNCAEAISGVGRVTVNNCSSNEDGCVIVSDKNSICVGETTELSVTISPTITDWKGYYLNWSTSSATTAAIGGTTSTTATLTGVSEGIVNVQYRYYHAKGGTFSSCTTTIDINVSPVTVAGNVDSIAYIEGAVMGTNLILTGNVGDVQYWERSENRSFTSPTVINIASSVLNVSGLPIGVYYYRAKVKSGNCTSRYSDVGTVTVTDCDLPSEYAINSEIICAGNSATLTLSGSETGVTYQLQNTNTNQNIGAVVNGTGNPINFTVTPATTTTYKIIATKGLATKELDSKALVTVHTLDSDGDGVPDYCDDDSDNDGILDSEECNNNAEAFEFTIPTSNKKTATSTLNTMSVSLVSTSQNPAHILTNQAISSGSYTGNNGITSVGKLPHILNKYVRTADDSNGATYTFTFTEATKQPLYLFISALDKGSKITFSKGVIIKIYNATGLHTSVLTPNANAPANGIGATVEIPTGITTFSFTRTTSGTSGDGYVFALSTTCGDIDGDGIPNYLDLDSDNDGCPDALEGGGTVTALQLVEAGGTVTGGVGSTVTKNLCATNACVNAKGVPTNATTEGVNATSGQNKGQSQQAHKIETTTSPTNQEVCVGSTASFTTVAKAIKTDGYDASHQPTYSASAPTENVNYQWQVRANSTSAWTNVTGTGSNGSATSGNTITYTTANTTTADNDKQYRVVFTSASMSCSKESAVATLTVTQIPAPVGTVTHPTCTVETGSVALSGLPSGTYSITATPNTGSAITRTGLTGTTYNFEGLEAGKTYTFIVTNANSCTSVPSETITVNAQPTTLTITGETTLCQGSTTLLTPKVAGGTWSRSNANVSIDNTKNLVTGVTVGTANITYTVGSCSQTYTITVNAKPTFTVSKSDVSCFETSPADGWIEVTATQGNAPFKFLLYKNGIKIKETTTGQAINTPYKFLELDEGAYKVLVIDANGCVQTKYIP